MPARGRARHRHGYLAVAMLAFVAVPGCRERHGARLPDPSAAQPATGQGHASETTTASPDADARPPDPGDLVDITGIASSICVEMRYATTGNFTGVAVYPVARCLLRRAVAERLARVEKALEARGLGLKLWDCYRPISVQKRFWQLVPDPRYVAEPIIENGVARRGSKHNRGAAVDLTLVDASGAELVMPSAHDDFTERAHRGYRGAGPEATRNARLLEQVMVAEGFTPLDTEWWHFDGPDWQRYPLEDVPLQ